MKLVIALALVTLARTADASCAFVELAPSVLTPRDAKIPADGGVVVGFDRKLPSGPKADAGGDPSVSSALAFGETAAVRESLAPGLTVYRPRTGASRGAKLELTAGGKRIAAFDSGPAAAALPAPIVESVAVESSFRGTATVRAHLGADAPAGAVALIVYGAGGALTYGQPGATRDIVVREGGHCSFPPGSAPKTGDHVTLAWVDASGHVSARSKPVTAK
ncbi:MAG TPA: hypothetical protein VGM88_05685 [Kofleriaceae bacterium]|jgi:hypothetical protein